MVQSIVFHGKKVNFQVPDSGISGIPLVLLHGFCEDASMWSPWLPDHTPNVIRVDLPGFGQSDPADDLDDYARSVMAVIDSLQIPKCVVMGHSMGGYTGLALAQHWPDRLAGLSLFHSHPFADLPEQAENRRRGITTLQEGKKDLYVAQLFGRLFSTSFIDNTPEIVNRMIANGRTQSVEGIIGALRAMMNRPDRTEVIKTIRCPLQVILGVQDTLIPYVPALGAALQAPVSDIQILENAAHMGMFEAPEATREMMINFWNLCLNFA